MTLAGWILLIFSWVLIILLNVFCFIRIFRREDDAPDQTSSPG